MSSARRLPSLPSLACLGGALLAACAPAAPDPIGVDASAGEQSPGSRADARRGCATIDPGADTRAAVRTRLATVPRPIAVWHLITIPVYVHVLEAGDGPTAVDDAQIAEQIAVLADAFAGGGGGADTGFRFELAEVDRTRNQVWSSLAHGSLAERQVEHVLHRGGLDTLNLYVAEALPGPLGWSSYPFWEDLDPDLDGVVVLAGSLPGGGAAPYDQGDTVVHEVGHWLGLLHTFEGGCDGRGDEVDDTPASSSGGFGCPVGRDTCGGDGVDPIENFMDYSDDGCMHELSAGQAIRVRSMWSTYRAGPAQRALDAAGDRHAVVSEVTIDSPTATTARP